MITFDNAYYAKKSKEWRARNPDKVKLGNVKMKAKIPTCHPDRKHKAKGLCQHCYRRHRIKTDPEFAIKFKQYEKQRSLKRSKDSKYKLNARNRMLKAQYGIDLNDYERIFIEQNGVCKICETSRITNKNKHLHVDHDHVTGKVRGLLCAKCNWYLGLIDKNINILYNLFKYKGINI